MATIVRQSCSYRILRAAIFLESSVHVTATLAVLILVAVLLVVGVAATKLVLVTTAAKGIARVVTVLLLITAEIPLAGVVQVTSEVAPVARVVSKTVRSATETAATESIGQVQSGQRRIRAIEGIVVSAGNAFA